jgi:hypothetical protein
MISHPLTASGHGATRWRMPIVPEDYDRRALTQEERWALERSVLRPTDTSSKQAIAVRRMLTRLSRPIADIYHLRHQGRSASAESAVQRIMRGEMLRRGNTFWDWLPAEWMETLCPSVSLFHARYGPKKGLRVTLMDAAYLLGEVTDLRAIGIAGEVSGCARVYFGEELLTGQCQRVLDLVAGDQGLGYTAGSQSFHQLRRCLGTLFLLNRSPYLEELSEEVIRDAGKDHDEIRSISHRVIVGLQQLGLFPPRPTAPLDRRRCFDSSGLAPEWFAWCQAWYDQAVDLTTRIREEYMYTLLATGRWLHDRVPEIRTPEQWTEELALRYRRELCTWTGGQYAGKRGRYQLERQGKFGEPLQAISIHHYLTAMRRYFTDLTRRAHAVSGAPARKIWLDFTPAEALATPAPIRRAVDVASPRDIDLRVWARLAIAAATLAPADLPHKARYPLSFYRALSLIWVTSARRPNEIMRLRLDCVREDWDPQMLNEDGQPVERGIPAGATPHPDTQKAEQTLARVFYLHIPAGKNRGAFWIWIPDYVAEAIEAWKQERPHHQSKLLDRKDREAVEYLFCHHDQRVGKDFLNKALIPILCRRAGLDVKDAKGRITGHRGRSTRLTLLRRNGVSLEDLADYAGHADTRSIRRYANQHVFQLHRIIKAADDVSRVLEGVIDVQAATQGLAALRWFIGYDADGKPMYCGNQLYMTCPHRLDCERCGMFIGGEKAKLLHEGAHTLPITAQVPMTPIERCVVNGDQEGAEACRAALRHVPVPQVPDIHLIFHPAGLSNSELEQLAELATSEALGMLRQALAVHEKRLEEAMQHKTGRSAVVGAQKKRVRFIQELLAGGERRRQEQEGR